MLYFYGLRAIYILFEIPLFFDSPCIYYLLSTIAYITMSRLWPTQLLNKDSRIRRELSAQGRDCFSCKDYDETLGR